MIDSKVPIFVRRYSHVLDRHHFNAVKHQDIYPWHPNVWTVHSKRCFRNVTIRLLVLVCVCTGVRCKRRREDASDRRHNDNDGERQRFLCYDPVAKVCVRRCG